MTSPYAPTLASLVRQSEAELPLSGASDTLRRNLFTPIARAVSALAIGLYGYQDWIVLQIDPATCDEDILLSVYVPMYLSDGRNEATAATGYVTFTGTVDYTVSQSDSLARNDGLEYSLTADVTIGSDGTASALVICTTAGLDGDTEPGGTLTLSSPVSGIDSSVTVKTPGITGGADEESIADLRVRVTEARTKTQGVGNSADWEAWAKEISGVTRAWAAPKLMGTGSMTVYFVRDNDSSIFPTDDEVATVASHLDQTGTPFGEIYVAGPTGKVINFTIKLNPNTSAVQAAVATALAGVISDEAAPVTRDSDGYTAMPVTGVTIPWTHFSAAISGSSGEWDHQLVSPATDVVCAVGELATMGTITWQ